MKRSAVEIGWRGRRNSRRGEHRSHSGLAAAWERAAPNLGRLLVFVLILHATSTSRAADPESPHPHQGLIEPFAGPPPELELDAAQERALAAGQSIFTSLEGKAGGRGLAVQDIAASPQEVWSRIRDFSDYPRMVDHIQECEPYYENGSDTRVRFVLKILSFRYEYYIKHDFRPEAGYASWTLDYSRNSDLDDSVGYWAVIPHPTKPGHSRLFYSIDMRMRGWFPGPLRRLLARQGLRTATSWVKREAESAAREDDELRATGGRNDRDRS
jgi:hypothetical protein